MAGQSSSAVMLATVIVVVATGNLSAGVLVGVLMSGVFFANKVLRLSGVTSAVGALDAVVMRERRRGIGVELVGLNQASTTMIERYGAITPWSRGSGRCPE